MCECVAVPRRCTSDASPTALAARVAIVQAGSAWTNVLDLSALDGAARGGRWRAGPPYCRGGGSPSRSPVGPGRRVGGMGRGPSGGGGGPSGVVGVGPPAPPPLVDAAQRAPCLLPLIKRRPIEEEQLVRQRPEQRNEDDDAHDYQRGDDKDRGLRGIVMHNVSSACGLPAVTTPVDILYP